MDWFYPVTCVLSVVACLVGSFLGVRFTLEGYTRALLSVESKWPDTVTKLIETAPTMLENASRTLVGVAEILNTVGRMGGLARILNNSRGNPDGVKPK